MALNIPQPEQYTLPSTAHVPNSPMPVLVYRNVLPMPRTMEIAQEFIESHGWSRQVGFALYIASIGDADADIEVGHSLACNIHATLSSKRS